MTADLDLRIKQIFKGCQWPKETEEQRMIDLLYHATFYYEIRKYIQEARSEAHSSTRQLSLKRQRLTRQKTALNTKTMKPHTEERTAHLHTITPCYLLMPLINIGPVAGIKAISVTNVTNLMSEAIVPLMGKLVTNVKALIISERSVIQRCQTGRCKEPLQEASNNNSPGEHLQAAMAKEEASSSSRRRRPRSIHHKSRKHTR